MPRRNNQQQRGGGGYKFCVYCGQEFSVNECPNLKVTGHTNPAFRRCMVCRSVVPIKGACTVCLQQKKERLEERKLDHKLHLELDESKKEYSCRSCGASRKGPGPCLACNGTTVPEDDIAVNSHSGKDGYWVTVHITRNGVSSGKVSYLYSIDGKKPIIRKSDKNGVDIIKIGWTNFSKKVTCTLVGTRSKSQEITLPKKKKPLPGFFSTSDPKEMWKAFFGKS